MNVQRNIERAIRKVHLCAGREKSKRVYIVFCHAANNKVLNQRTHLDER